MVFAFAAVNCAADPLEIQCKNHNNQFVDPHWEKSTTNLRSFCNRNGYAAEKNL